ncbi:pilus assembly protein PilZ [Bradyrhizobium sp. SSBR45G]|uniref:PilZ domain-containing protein n=1 Tax=unclassified Bradyrhizobium TaxID=2631580 RepID=UPI002342BC05|nr:MULTISPECIES: PilZ domain-containing protein [unclassified Bradyrhizobium]GLH77386.1 pilus assembly protein PilZ [Bradyrhizobium sp. SSBR45G]GLH84508.1 pilus assembly protein PilZ [Bradyrhizobium sp. SSBR45R]
MSVARFLKQRAVRIQTAGSYTLPNWYDPEGKLRSFACRTTRVSPFRALLDVPVVGKIGDRLTSYFRDFGKFEGEISDTIHGGFLLELEMTRAERAKLAEKLVWLEKKQKDPTIRDSRRDARVVPNSPHSALTLADGSIIPCFVIDASVSGAAVSAEIQPEIGTPLAVGSCVGRVVRHFPDGFAIRFVDPLSATTELERRVITPPARPTRQRLVAHGDDGRIEAPEDFFMV